MAARIVASTFAVAHVDYLSLASSSFLPDDRRVSATARGSGSRPPWPIGEIVLNVEI
jgi:hypothetical protein